LLYEALKNKNKFNTVHLLERLELKSFNSFKTKGIFESIYLFHRAYFSVKNLVKEASLIKIGK